MHRKKMLETTLYTLIDDPYTSYLLSKDKGIAKHEGGAELARAFNRSINTKRK